MFTLAPGRHFHASNAAQSPVLYKRPSMQFLPHELAEPLPSVAAASSKDEVVVIVDPFSTGAVITHLLNQQGYQVVCLLSRDLGKLLDMVADGNHVCR